jgi:hypothetical protein
MKIIGCSVGLSDQVAGNSNFGGIEIGQWKMLSSKGFLVFRPPQLCDR